MAGYKLQSNTAVFTSLTHPELVNVSTLWLKRKQSFRNFREHFQQLAALHM